MVLLRIIITIVCILWIQTFRKTTLRIVFLSGIIL